MDDILESMFDGHDLVYTYSDWQHSNHCLAPVTHWGPGPASAGESSQRTQSSHQP